MDYPRMPAGICYEASRLFAACFSELAYAEGFLTILRDGEPVAVANHAWTVRDDGQIVDPTMKPGEGEVFNYTQGKTRRQHVRGIFDQVAEGHELLVWCGQLAALIRKDDIERMQKSWAHRVWRWLFPSATVMTP